MSCLLPDGLIPGQTHIEAYDDGWRHGRAGNISLPVKYQDDDTLQAAYRQGYYDAQAGRDNNIIQDRTYPED